MAGIFISYRREDAGGHAGRLCDRLTTRFGDDRVFMDIQDIKPGQNFEHSIDATMAGCDCVLAVIGPRWLESVRARTGSEDFVRRELAAALARNVTLIPVLVGGARMPSREALPPELAPLARRNAIDVRDDHFDDDVSRLLASLDASVGATPGAAPPHPRRRARWRVAAIACLAAMAAAAATLAGSGYWRLEEPVPLTEPPPIAGAWIAEMQKPGQRPYRIRLEFHGSAADYTGTVHYPTGDGIVRDLVLNGTALTFITEHLPQFETSPATIRYQGQVTGEELRLRATDSAGVATGTARRAPPPPR